VELRADAGVPSSDPSRMPILSPSGQIPAEQARAADRAERLHASVVRPEDADQLLTGEQAKALARNASLRQAEGPGVLSAARAVAMIGPEKGRRHLEADAAAQAGAAERAFRTWVAGHLGWIVH